MIFQKLRLIDKNQRGFTLLELLIVLAISSMVITSLVLSISQVFTVSARTSSHVTAVRQVQNAGHWVSRDGQMAYEVGVDPGVSGFPLTLSWTEMDDTENVVTYAVVGSDLQRSYSVNGGAATDIIVAQFIDSDPANTNCTFSDNMLVLTVTAAVGGFPEEVIETREYQIVPRPGI